MKICLLDRTNFEYSYDAFGNWTERKEFKKSGARESQGAHLKRIIEYYEESEYKHPPLATHPYFWVLLDTNATLECQTVQDESQYDLLEMDTTAQHASTQCDWSE